MPDPVRPSTMSTHKMRQLAASGRGERILPGLFAANTDPLVRPRHVIDVHDVTQGLGLPAALSERVQGLVGGENVSFAPRGGTQRLVQGRGRLTEFLRAQDIELGVRQEIEKRALAFWRRTQTTDLAREPVMRFAAVKSERDLEPRIFMLRKSVGHKYVRRMPDGKGGWTYFYTTPAKKGAPSKSAEIKEGADAGKYGKIHKIEHDGNTVTIHRMDLGEGKKYGPITKFRSEDGGENWKSVKADSEHREGYAHSREDMFHHLLAPQHGYKETPKELRQKRPAKPKPHAPEGSDLAGPVESGKVRVANRDGTHEEVAAQIHGNFAVHGEKGAWRVTHVPSGLNLGHHDSKGEASAYAKHMKAHANDVLSHAKFGQTKFAPEHEAERKLFHEHHTRAKEAAAKSKEPKAPKDPHLTVEKKADGTHEVIEHKTKKEAHAHGMKRRAEGADIFAYPKSSAHQFGLDPRTEATPKADHLRVVKSERFVFLKKST